jgi:hypothetical protein
MAIDLLPDLTSTCVELVSGNGELCIRFPGGAQICASMNATELGDLGEIAKSLLAQANTALAPLQPFFNLLDVIKAIFDCIQAIPDALGPPPDPSGIIACVPNLAKAVEKLLKLIPPIPIFELAKDILHVIITALQGIRAKLLAMLRQLERIAAAALAATTLGSLQLQLVVDCAQGNIDAQMANMNAGMAPLNRLIGLLNVLLQLAGLDCIPALGDFGELSEAILAPLDAVISLLQQLLALIPTLDLVLPEVVPGQCL